MLNGKFLLVINISNLTQVSAFSPARTQSAETLWVNRQDMSRLKTISIIILAFVLTNCNTSDKESAHKQKYKTVTTFLQVDTLSKFKYMIETQDLTGKTLELIRYSETTELINYIEKCYYDSLQRRVLTNMTWFPNNKHSNTNIYQTLYDSNGLISKSISTMGQDTNTVYYEYFPNKKTKQSKTISTSDVWWKGITKYIYDKNDSLVKQESWGLNGENLQNRDSIAYTDTSKIVFEFHFANEISSKVVTIIKNNKIVQQIEYLTYTMSKDKEFYVDKETSFTYSENLLTKKVIKTMAHTEWCGVERPKKMETYTYLYE